MNKHTHKYPIPNTHTHTHNHKGVTQFRLFLFFLLFFLQRSQGEQKYLDDQLLVDGVDETCTVCILCPCCDLDADEVNLGGHYHECDAVGSVALHLKRPTRPILCACYMFVKIAQLLLHYLIFSRHSSLVYDVTGTFCRAQINGKTQWMKKNEKKNWKFVKHLP